MKKSGYMKMSLFNVQLHLCMIYPLCRDASKVSLRSVLILFRILHVETMFGNEGEGFLHACISSLDVNESNVNSNLLLTVARKKNRDLV